MEDFLKNKLNDLENNFQDDWNVFEQKLERALFFKRLRIGAAVSFFLIATSIGIFGTSSIIDFQNSDEAPFGVYTQEGFESSGSKSQWGGTENYNIDEGVGDESKNIAAVEPEATTKAAVVDAGPKPVSTKNTITENISGNQEAAEVESIAAATISNTDDGAEPLIDTEANAVVNDSYVATTSIVGEEVFKADPSPDEVISGKSQIIDLTGKVAKAEISDGAKSDVAQNQAADYAEKTQVEGDKPEPIAEVADENIVAVVTTTTAATEEDLYDLEPLDLKTLNLDLPSLGSINGADAMGLQVRMPVAAIKSPAQSKGPFISPLQSKSLWEYSLKVYPNFTFRKFKVDEDKANFIHRDFVDQVKVSESGGFSMNIGLEVSRRIGLATYLKGGLEYISYNHSANFDFTNYRSANIDEKTGAITSYFILDEPNQVVINDKNTYHYLNLPLSISYQPWASDHIRLNMEAGVSYMYFVTASGESIDYRTLEIIDLSEREFKNSLGSINLKVGATYYISPQFNLGFEPTFVYFTNTIYSDEYPFEVIPYSVGLNLKLQVKLN